MKKRFVMGVLLAVVLTISLMLTGCAKTTGGGSFTSSDLGDGEVPWILNHFCTFGFNAKPVIAPDSEGWILAKGNFNFWDHTSKMKVAGDFTITNNATEAGFSGWLGLCSANRTGQYVFFAAFADNTPDPDKIMLIVYDTNDITAVINEPYDDILYAYFGVLDPGSDIVVHSK